VNSFESTAQLEMSVGDSQNMYFQLVDSSIDRTEQGFSPAGRRYMPPVGSTLAVTFVNVVGGSNCGSGSGGGFGGGFVRYATQPFIQDASIWSVPILSTDPLVGTISLKMLLNEPNRRLSVTFTPGVMLRMR
jgi:hypothetical protein